MLPALLFTAVIAGATLAKCADRDHRPAFELVVRLSQSRLSLLNPGSVSELVILRDPVRGRSATLALAPHTQVEFACDANALCDLEFVILERDHDGLHFSPRIELESLVRRGDARAIRFGACSDHLHASTAIVETNTSGAPLPISAPNASPARHVPVITPSEGQVGDLPPRLEEKPLPAV